LRSEGITVEDEHGLRYTAQVDVFGREFERKDGLGRMLRRTYDPEGRLTKVDVDGSYAVEFSYTAEGQLTGMVDSEDRETRRQYDAFGRLQQYLGPDEQRWTFQYDREGRLVGAANARKQPLELSYDERGWLTRLVAPDGATTTFQHRDEHIIVENGTGTHRHTYTPLGELEAVVRPDGTEQTLTYGPSGEFLVLEAEETLFADYDADGNLAAIDLGESSVAFTHDRDGHLTGIEADAGGHVGLRRDARGRPVAVQMANGGSYDLTYDGADRLTGLSGPERIEFSYDALDRLQETVIRHASGETERIAFNEDDAPRETVLGTRAGEDASSISPDEPADSVLVVAQASHRIVLFVRMDGLHIPVLVQDDLLHREGDSLREHILYTCVEGPDALLDEGRDLYDRDLHRRWSTGTVVGLDLAAIPGPRAVRGMPLLRSFFLQQPFMDRPSARMLRDESLHARSDRRGGFDPLITGTHREGRLNPLVWPERHIASRLRRTTMLFRRGGVTPDDVLRLFARPSPRPMI
jgi:YD repeat-containing protein